MDFLTKYPECVPIPDILATTIARAFVNNIILRHGVLRCVLTDQSSQFLSTLFKEVCTILKIEILQTSAYHSQSKGILERFHATLKSMISHYLTSSH